MGLPAVELQLTLADFLDWEEGQSLRHEFLRGEVFAMAGAEDRHVTVAGNVFVALRRHLAGSGCRVYIGDMKLRVDAADAVFYPDVFVSCSAADAASRQIKRDARLIVEVLSPATAAFDRGDKFAAYRQVGTLEEYLLLDIARRSAELFRKGADGLWVLHPFGPGEAVQLASVALSIGAAELWADVEGEASGSDAAAAAPPASDAAGAAPAA
jgi:Uma2 family endonuclease